MERSKKENLQIPNINQADLHTLASALVARVGLASKLGMQYGTDRNIYQALGYKSTAEITYDDYLGYYTRHEMGKAVIDRPVKATWQGDIILEESEINTESQFAKAWQELNRNLKLKSVFSRVDRLTGIGSYGVLLLGLDDVKSTVDFLKPAPTGRKIKYIKPIGEKSALIKTFEIDPNNPRYGLPLTYSVVIVNMLNQSSITVEVHYTRIVHIVDDPLESEIESAPRLEVLINRLMDLEKIVGGDAEMFWRGARPGYHGKIDKDFQMTNEVREGLKDQLDEMEHNLRRYLINEGVDIEALAQQIADPKNHVDIQIQMISAVTGIPKRILTGSERGELSSAQDTEEWKVYVQNRREEQAEMQIIRPFVDRCIELKILPKPSTGYYKVKWTDLFAISEMERVKIGQLRSTALRDYTQYPMAESIVPPKAFMKEFLGFDDKQINGINTKTDEEIEEEQKALPQNEDQAQIDPQKQKLDATKTI
jgi:uncharacterized protein